MKQLLLSLCVCIALIGKGQDTINMRSGEAIVAKVNDIGTTEIKYKKWGRLDGPVYSVLKTDVANIKYSDGTKDEFDQAKDYVSITLQENANGKTPVPYKQENIPPNPNAHSEDGFTDENEAQNLRDSLGRKQGKWKEILNKDGDYELRTYHDDILYGTAIRHGLWLDGKKGKRWGDGKPVIIKYDHYMTDYYNEKGYLKKYYEFNGQLASKVPIIDGKRNGVEKGYYESGYLKYEIPYVDDKRNGVSRWYEEDGKLDSINNYANGALNGLAMLYYQNYCKHLSFYYETITYIEKMYSNGAIVDGWNVISHFESGARDECFYNNGEFKRVRHISSDGVNHDSFLSILGRMTLTGLQVVANNPSLVNKNSSATTGAGNNNNSGGGSIDNGAVRNTTPKQGAVRPLPAAASDLSNKIYTGQYSDIVYQLLRYVYKNYSDGKGGATIPIADCCIRDGDVAMAVQYAWACLSYQADINNTSYQKAFTPEQAAQKMKEQLDNADKLCSGNSLPGYAPTCQCLTLNIWPCN